MGPFRCALWRLGGNSKTPSPTVDSSGWGLGSLGEWGRARWVRKDWAEGWRGRRVLGADMVVLLQRRCVKTIAWRMAKKWKESFSSEFVVVLGASMMTYFPPNVCFLRFSSKLSRPTRET